VSLYNLARPKLPQVKEAGRLADGAVGILNGVIGGATGLAGIVTVVWTSMRGWSRDEQRAVFQPTGVASFIMIIVAFGGIGIITFDTIRLVPARSAGAGNWDVAWLDALRQAR
jgi:hypothetical protein